MIMVMINYIQFIAKNRQQRLNLRTQVESKKKI